MRARVTVARRTTNRVKQNAKQNVATSAISTTAHLVRLEARSTGAQVVEIDSELFQICCGCFGMATPGCGDACLMVLDDLHCVLQAVAACRVRQGERVDQCVRGSVDLVQRDLRIFPPAAGSPAATETSGSLE